MSYEDNAANFREWLLAGGRTRGAVSTRISRLRNLDRKLAEINAPHGTLAEAYEADSFVSLLTHLDDLRQSLQDGDRTVYALSNITDPSKELHQLSSQLRLYRRFLDREPPVMVAGPSGGKTDVSPTNEASDTEDDVAIWPPVLWSGQPVGRELRPAQLLTLEPIPTNSLLMSSVGARVRYAGCTTSASYATPVLIRVERQDDRGILDQQAEELASLRMPNLRIGASGSAQFVTGGFGLSGAERSSL